MKSDNLVLVKSFAKEIDARIASAHLESQGIAVHLTQDDAGGSYPQLQMTSGIRLMVNPEDEAQAKAILDEIESESSSSKAPTNTKPSRANSVMLVLLFLAGVALGYLIGSTLGKHQPAATKDVYETDTNGDKKPDVFEYYRQGVLIRVEQDRNYDGKVDSWVYYNSGRITSRDDDDNFDGKIDTWTKYKDENNWEVKIDTDFNGKPDATIYVINQMKSRVDWRPNESPVIVRQEIYQHGNKKEELRDTNGDGKFDVRMVFDAFGNEAGRGRIK